MRGHKLTLTEFKRLLTDLSEGHHINDCARFLGIHPDTAFKYLRGKVRYSSRRYTQKDLRAFCFFVGNLPLHHFTKERIWSAIELDCD